MDPNFLASIALPVQLAVPIIILLVAYINPRLKDKALSLLGSVTLFVVPLLFLAISNGAGLGTPTDYWSLVPMSVLPFFTVALGIGCLMAFQTWPRTDAARFVFAFLAAPLAGCTLYLIRLAA